MYSPARAICMSSDHARDCAERILCTTHVQRLRTKTRKSFDFAGSLLCRLRLELCAMEQMCSYAGLVQ
jgi:hypothetical protein